MIDLNPFIELGLQQLRIYLSGIEEFIRNPAGQPRVGSQELRQKPPSVYLRNMLTVGVLSLLTRDAFLKTEKRLIVLPECLKNYGEWSCCKADSEGAAVCTQCNSDCIVFESMERFADGNTEIVLEPDDLEDYLRRIIERDGHVGVVGVACALTLLSGFKTSLSLKLPTQGVFLNYASCGHHWANPPYNTSYSLRRLARVLGREDRFELGEIGSSGTGQTYSLIRRPNSPDDFYARLDKLADLFKRNYLPRFQHYRPDADIYDICLNTLKALVPDLITRDSA